MTLSILTTTFTEGAERNRALGLWGAMGGAGGAAGALLGGVLTDVLGWQWVLFINVPIGLGAALAAARFVARSARTPRGDATTTSLGAVTVTAGLMLLTYAIVRTDVHGWASAATLVAGGAGLALLGAFLAIEGRARRARWCRSASSRSRTLSAANIVVFFLGCAVFAMWYFVSLYLQQVLGYSPIETGVAFLPMTAAIILASTVAPRVAERLGPRIVLAFGMALVAVGMLVFSTLPPAAATVDVLVPGIVAALGLGFSFVPVTIAAMSGIARAQAGLASGLINTSRQFGGSLGLAVLATIASQTAAGHGRARADRRLPSRVPGGRGFAALGALVALVGLRERRPVDVPASAGSSHSMRKPRRAGASITAIQDSTLDLFLIRSALTD